MTTRDFRRSWRRRIARLAVLAAALTAAGGCRIARDMLPRTHTVSRSPDGRYTAYVQQHLNPDPPDDHLYLGASGAAPKRLMSLAPDADWCRTVIWTADSRRGGFVISDQRLAVFDTNTAELEAMLVLVAADGYPGALEARDVAFEGDGTTVTFERFQRPVVLLSADGGRLVEAPVTTISHNRRPDTPARSRGRASLKVPSRRLQLQLAAAASGTAADAAWVKLVTKDRRQIVVQVVPTADGVARMPAFDNGPFTVVEIFFGAQRRHAVMHDVRITETPVVVTYRDGGSGGA